MSRKAWGATVHGAARVRHNLAGEKREAQRQSSRMLGCGGGRLECGAISLPTSLPVGHSELSLGLPAGQE